MNFDHEHGKPNVCRYHGLPFATSGFPLPVDPVSSGTSGSLDLFVCCRVCYAFLTFHTMTSNTSAVQKVQSIVTFENLWYRNGTSGWPNFATTWRGTPGLSTCLTACLQLNKWPRHGLIGENLNFGSAHRKYKNVTNFFLDSNLPFVSACNACIRFDNGLKVARWRHDHFRENFVFQLFNSTSGWPNFLWSSIRTTCLVSVPN